MVYTSVMFKGTPTAFLIEMLPCLEVLRHRALPLHHALQQHWPDIGRQRAPVHIGTLG